MEGSGSGKMVEYKIVKYCGNCKKKFVVNRGESRRYLCDECEKKMRTVHPDRS